MKDKQQSIFLLVTMLLFAGVSVLFIDVLSAGEDPVIFFCFHCIIAQNDVYK